MNAKTPNCGQDYLVIDLSGGARASQYPIRYMDEPPDVADNACKLSELWLRHIPAGSFMMGSADYEFDDERQHRVTLTRDYYIGIFPCTQQQYKLVMGEDPTDFDGWDKPVEQVAYENLRGRNKGSKWPAGSDVDGSSFFGRLRKRTGLTFDLPTEAEWEYACRAGTMGKRYGVLDDIAWYDDSSDDSIDSTQGVGQKHPNAWGLYDMLGNVCEWCRDWYGDYPESEVKDPVGASSGSYRVWRGGCWGSDADGCSTARRGSNLPSYRGNYIGFRLALVP